MGQDFWDKLTVNFVEEFNERMIKFISYIDGNVLSSIIAFIGNKSKKKT